MESFSLREKVPDRADEGVYYPIIKLSNYIYFLTYRRQCPLGHYIVDFICIEKMLIIEIDGGQHNEKKHQDYDKHRTAFLNTLGYTVLRFWNNEILQQFDVVMDQIYQHVCCVA